MNIQEFQKLFFNLYGNPQKTPRLFFAPGRVNLIGEHTDYNGGFVLPCALQYGTYLLIRKRPDNLVRFATTNFDYKIEYDISKGYVKQQGQWINYPLGIFDQFDKLKIGLSGFDMLFSGDIPNSAGLSSSASIEMVTAFALASMLNVTSLEMTDLVNLSKRSENEFIGLDCGIMDMFAVGMGSADHAIFLNCLTLEFKRIPFILNGYKLIIANTNKKRGLADSKYNERVQECKEAIDAIRPHIPVNHLGEIGFMQFFKIQELIEDERVRRRARHVISENQRVLNAVSCLHKNDLLQFGALMNASHESLRDNYEVTGIELDTLVEEAWKINGVIGSRMTGAGFGGCTVSIVRDNVVEKFIHQAGDNYRQKTGLTASFYIAEVSDGTREIITESV
ncbi:MAG: galactokinase [Bacteroidetes bacterium]|nr:galactokinase [Bacteroidota bacterium]